MNYGRGAASGSPTRWAGVVSFLRGTPPQSGRRMSEVNQQIGRSFSREAEMLRASLARAAGGDRHLAEDIAQESWLRAVVAWPTQGVPERPGAWLRTVSRNILFNEGRRRRSVRLDDVAPGVLRISNLDAVTDAAEQHGLLHAALGELPPKDRQLVESHYFGGLTLAEIAARHGLTERAVEGRLRRLRIRLRGVLESRGITSAELRGLTPTTDLSLATVGKALLLAPLLPYLLVLAGYFTTRRLAARLTTTGRAVGQLGAGLSLILLGTIETPDIRSLQLFGLGTLLLGVWRLWRQSSARVTP